MECKEFVLEEYLERIVNNTYLTELVEEYNNNQTKENFVNLCEVLSYRDLFLGMCMVILDKQLKKKMKKGYQVDQNEINADTCIKEFVKYEISSDSGNHKFLGVFTEPKKVMSKDVNANTIINVDFQKLVDEVLNEEEVDGIIINPGEQNIILENHFIHLIYNKDFDKILTIKKAFEITDRVKQIDDELSKEYNEQLDNECNELMKQLFEILNEFN